MRTIDTLREELRAAGARPRHETLALRAWARGLPLDAFARREDSQFPARLRAALPALAARFAALAVPRSEHDGADGSTRLLLALGDGRTIESVLLPGDGVCVSTQVGCAVGCLFCMTGRGGLERQLGGAEIVAQVALARARRPIRRVVLMGMGEPAHNLDEVLCAIELLGTEGDLNNKNLVLSTVGDRRVFERLPRGRVKPALALSLHTTKPALRAELLPRAPRIEPAELVELAERYARETRYPTQYQWTLLEGVNDGDDELEALAALLAGKYAVMNFIPYNETPAAGFRRPSWQRAAAMTRYLGQRGILAKVRRSAGQDVEAGCGQLRARAAADGGARARRATARRPGRAQRS
jgi:23S rRNA (adenine2503-C2)-methyltransferase